MNLLGKHTSDRHAEFARYQRLELAANHLGGELGDARLKRRIDAPHQDAPHTVIAGQHRLPGHIRRAIDNQRIALALLKDRFPVEHRLAGGNHFDMRQHRQHPVAHFLLKTVHDRQHDDERGHSERDSGH